MVCDVKCVSLNPPHCHNGFALNLTLLMVSIITVRSSFADQVLFQTKFHDGVCFLNLCIRVSDPLHDHRSRISSTTFTSALVTTVVFASTSFALLYRGFEEDHHYSEVAHLLDHSFLSFFFRRH